MPHQSWLARALTTAAFLALTLLAAPARAQVCLGSSDSVNGWIKYAPKGEEFSIRMPSTPTYTTRTIRTGKGQPPMVARDYVVMGPVASRGFGPENPVRYGVTSMELPAQAGGGIKREEFDKLMYTLQESFEKGLQKNAPNLYLGSPREVISGVHKGREYGIEGGLATYDGHVRFFVTAKHIYIVAYVNFSYYGTCFLDSFELSNDNPLVIR